MEGLYAAITYLSEGPPLTTNQPDFILGLAYEIRHANQGDRESLSIPLDENEELIYSGVYLIWPIFLIQLTLLRTSAAYHPTTKKHRATLLRLEACAEDALVAFDPVTGAECAGWLYTFPELDRNYDLDFVVYCSHGFIYKGKPGKTRFKRLPKILEMLRPTSMEYLEYIEQRKRAADARECKPEALRKELDWPDFKW